MDTFLVIASWIAPPILGGLIGYWTNRVAIMMLFRPLTSKFVLGVHVPLTPGVIPARREELAESVGNLVGDEFLSRAAIKSYMSQPVTQDALKSWLREETPIGRIPESISGRLAESIAGYIVERAPDLLGKVDAGVLIANKVNDYKTAEVEKLILSLAGEHLRWISWFGALLGTVIGCLQLLLKMIA